MTEISYSDGQIREFTDSKVIEQLMQRCPERDMLRFSENYENSAVFNMLSAICIRAKISFFLKVP